MSDLKEIKIESKDACCSTSEGADACCSTSTDDSACCSTTTGSCC